MGISGSFPRLALRAEALIAAISSPIRREEDLGPAIPHRIRSRCRSEAGTLDTEENKRGPDLARIEWITLWAQGRFDRAQSPAVPAFNDPIDPTLLRFGNILDTFIVAHAITSYLTT